MWNARFRRREDQQGEAIRVAASPDVAKKCGAILVWERLNDGPTTGRSMLASWPLKVVKFVSPVVPRENRASTVLHSQP